MGFVDDNIMSHVKWSDMFVACSLVTPRAVFVITVHNMMHLFSGVAGFPVPATAEDYGNKPLRMPVFAQPF